MHGARLHKTSRRHNGLRRDLLGRDRDILLQDETRDASVQDRDETETLRILSETRPRQDVSTYRDRDVSTETTSLLFNIRLLCSIMLDLILEFADAVV